MEKFRLDRTNNEENTTRVVAARQNVLLLWRATLNYTPYYDLQLISVKLNIGFCVSLKLICLIPNIISKYYIQYDGFPRKETQHEVAHELLAKE